MRIRAIVIAFLMFSIAVGAEETSLYSITVDDAPTKDGKQAAFTFIEIERTPTKSVVEPSALVGGSVSGPMLIMKCMCGLTRARGERFFTSKPLSFNPIRMEVTFPKSGPEPTVSRDMKRDDSNIFSLAQCDLLQF